MTVLARPQIDLTTTAPDWDNWTSSTGVAAQPQGSLVVQPAFNTVYMLVVAWGPNSWIYSAPIQVAVNLPPANPLCPNTVNVSTVSLMTVPNAGPSTGVAPASPQPCRRKVTIYANNLAPLLVQALETPNTTVIVPDGVELDLTPHLGGPITIADGVQLIGGRIAEPGKRSQRGPRLFVTPNPYLWDPVNGLDPSFLSHWPDPLFQIGGDNVRISGVRLEGPGAPPDTWKSIPQGPGCSNSNGCTIGYTRGIRFVDRVNIEIDHNEFSGWNTAAVEAAGIELTTGPSDRVWQMWTSKVTSDSSGLHYPAGLEPVYIHDNYFHNNWYPPSPAPWSSCSPASPSSCEPYFGYGVAASGTHVLIERNVFNDYYHAISADGCSGSGYRAYRNLVLATGDPGSQAFDVHHRRPSDCGGNSNQAGHDFDLRWNSFLYTGFYAFRIDGTPDVLAVADFNVFAQDHIDDAVHSATGNGLVHDFNLLGVKSWDDPGHRSDSCDFDGDGINDTFITTGETWWFRSGDTSQGPTPWVFLNTSLFLVPDVSLVPASSHPGCDVYAGGLVYPGGTLGP
jgi:hypothetical protein